MIATACLIAVVIELALGVWLLIGVVGSLARGTPLHLPGL